MDGLPEVLLRLEDPRRVALVSIVVDSPCVPSSGPVYRGAVSSVAGHSRAGPRVLDAGVSLESESRRGSGQGRREVSVFPRHTLCPPSAYSLSSLDVLSVFLGPVPKQAWTPSSLFPEGSFPRDSKGGVTTRLEEGRDGLLRHGGWDSGTGYGSRRFGRSFWSGRTGSRVQGWGRRRWKGGARCQST